MNVRHPMGDILMEVRQTPSVKISNCQQPLVYLLLMWFLWLFAISYLLFLS